MLPRGRFWTVPNVLSLSRLVLLPLFIWALATPGYLWLAGVLLLWGVLSDVADGYLARKLDQQSEWGRLLDPVADKLTLGVALGYCYVARDLPLWVLLLVVGRDLAILLLARVLADRAGRLPASIMVGRLAALSLGLLAIVYVLEVDPLKRPMLAVSVFLLFLSSLMYARRLWTHAD